jgi:polysaccharide deacetylase 2 family uncharacterized protein YibQ
VRRLDKSNAVVVAKGDGSSRRRRDSWRFPLAVLGAIALLACGCKSQKQLRPSPAQVHSITREMVRTASGFGKHVSVTSRLRFDGVDASRTDQIVVTLGSAPSEQSRQEAVTRLIQSLDRIGTTHSLSRDSESSSGALLILNYRRAGLRTQSVHIIAPSATPASTASAQAGQPIGRARLAIILDDLGSDRAAADEIFALAYPLTISVLPGHAHSTEIAEEAHRRGYEVLLHLPMQSVAKEAPEAQELRPGMAPDDIPVLFEQMMQSVPNAAGVNNHQGSQATADAALMQELMPVLQQWNLFYVDSRTSAATVAYNTAQHAGVRSAFRNAPFLDDVPDVPAVRKQLQLAFRKAQEKGEAITIGHPHPATLQALREELPAAGAVGVRLVFVSQLVH